MRTFHLSEKTVAQRTFFRLERTDKGIHVTIFIFNSGWQNQDIPQIGKHVKRIDHKLLIRELVFHFFKKKIKK